MSKIQIEFKIGGVKKEVAYDEGDALLDTAIRNEINAPYSCMEGMCTACLAQIREGKVDLPEDTILDEDEIRAGKTLTCQAKPQAGCSRVVVDYDL